MAHDVFISYFRGEEQGNAITPDRRVADRICTDLENEGISCFIDHRDILPGGDWLNSILDGVEQSKILILVVSKNTDQSQWIKDEITLALKKNIKIIPFRIETVPIKDFLRVLDTRCQWIYSSKQSSTSDIAHLVDAVSTHLGNPVARVNELDVPVKKKAKSADVQRLENLGYLVKKNARGYWKADFGNGIVMVRIPAGKFVMGSNNYEDHEKPEHEVHLDTFWLGKTEVTVGQFEIFCKETEYRTQAEKEDGAYVYIDGPWKNKKDENWQNPYFEQTVKSPVVCVSWNDIIVYCEWLSKRIGLKFHLPTEAQWEKGFRGTNGQTYPWGEGKPNKALANFGGNIGSKTSPVDSYPNGVSPYGLLDMAGNVWEWCKDWYKEDYYKDSPSENPVGPRVGSDRVIRGGSWLNSADFCRASFRFFFHPDFRDDFLGFRLAMSL